MSVEWLVRPEWPEGDNWEPAVGTGEVIEAASADEARDFYLTHGDGAKCRPWRVWALPASECRRGAVEAGRRKASERSV